MSNRYKGGVISATPPTTTGGESGTASGAWTLEQQMQLTAAGNWPIQPLPKYIEDVFSTYLYTGNGSTQTITNGIDLAGEGGLVWQKRRDSTSAHYLFDTARGNDYVLNSNTTSSQGSGWSPYFSFGSSGFSVDAAGGGFNLSNATYASWTFREQPKFFDVVTYTGDGTNDRNVPHNLGSVPGCYIVKATSTTSDWYVYHRSLASPSWFIRLNTTGAQTSASSPFDSAPTSTTFNVWNGTNSANASGVTYVAYLFAHNAGGFGLTGTDNVISCGSWVGNGAALGAEVNLGYEPQWLLIKDASSGTENWIVVDNMRGMAVEAAAVDSGDALLFPNLTNVEIDRGRINPTSTGFIPKELWNTNGDTYIYIAIRRGPMKVPTSGTSVFTPIQWSGDYTQTLTPGFPPDLVMQNANINATPSGFYWGSRMQGNTAYLTSTSSGAEGSYNSWQFNKTTGTFTQSLTTGTLGTSIDYFLRRAPSVFDIVCYTGDGASPRSITHNLGVAPELMIVKKRNTGDAWAVGVPVIGATKELWLNSTIASYTDAQTFSSAPTSTVFNIGYNGEVNTSGGTYVAYLFATCPGVSKVGTYTGTGASRTIDCGFTTGARFIMIKRSDGTGDWTVFDSARGIIVGSDPFIALNNADPQTVGADVVSPNSTGFNLTTAGFNVSGQTFIFLAIA